MTDTETARLHDEILTGKAEIAKLRDLLTKENRRANQAIDREETAEQAAEEAHAELKHAHAALARIRQMADHWEQHLPEVIRTPAVVSALRAALDRAGSAVVAPPTDHTETDSHPQSTAARFLDAFLHRGPGYDLTPPHLADRAAAPADRAAVLREEADRIDATRADFPIAVQNGITWATAEMRRHAAEAQPDPGARHVHITIHHPDPTTANTAAHAIADLIRGEYSDSLRLTITTDAPGTGAAPRRPADETPDTTTQPDLQVWPLRRILTEVRCGSADWSWDEEWADLDRRHAETGYLDTLEAQIRERGITMPVLIGSDGRLWDGHHRLRIAVRAGIEYVPVEIVLPAAGARQDGAQR